ncbi:hypothetical protein, partial [Stenotrophomonas maltophilia]|uniref:hypothetical protein n=1 Tax=Stenotrophomonas maltophilia TaxID=40324 RepID=UPI00240E53B9
MRVHSGLKKEEQEQEQQHRFRVQIRFPQENGSAPSSHLETQRSCRPSQECREGWVGVGWRDRLIWPPENGRHEAVSGGSPELPGVVVR